MASPPDIWTARDWPTDWHVEVVGETGSTMDDLAEAARRGAPARSVLLAAHQTAGRGRLDRRWEAPAGENLLVSILLRAAPDHPAEITQRVGLAAVTAVDRLVPDVITALKWPNDVVVVADGVPDAKLAGILAQRVDDAFVVGVGMNVGWCPPGAARLADHLADHGAAVDPPAVLDALLRAFDAVPGSGAALHAAYRSRLSTLGRRVRVELPSGEDLVGVAVDVATDGRLIVDDGRQRRTVDVGDIVHLRLAD